MNVFELGGLIAAPYTAFAADGALNLTVIEQQARSLIDAGVKGAFICGTTGEGLSMTTAERMDVAKRWIDVAGKTALKVIVHVGHNSQRDAIALAAHAQKIGASAIGALPPFFFKPSNVEQVVEFMRPIAMAASSLPFYYYHIPTMTGVSASMHDFLQVAPERIGNLRGIKFTHGDLMDYQRCKKFADGQYDVAWGVDEMLLGALAVGATSAVGSTYNYAAPLYHRMIAAYKRGDMKTANDAAANSVEMISVLLKHGVLRTGKATMAMRGIDCGPPRAPITPLSDDELSAIRRAYDRMGFFDWSIAKPVTVSVSSDVKAQSARKT
jgi:N-acetylneuraminate lyase